jgi:hypothetical protein
MKKQEVMCQVSYIKTPYDKECVKMLLKKEGRK